MGLNKLNNRQQSENVIRQHGDLWRKHAEMHAAFAPFKSLEDFRNIGIGKALIIIANGASLEEQIDVLVERHHGHDIMCCDKSLGHLLSRGIKPTFCLVADAKVNYEKYLKPFETQLSETILLMNVTANPQWSHNGNWKDKYFFVNFDVIRSEIEFMRISGCQNKVAAATNVSNNMVVFATQSDNKQRQNYFGYDKILLLGFDYSWRPDGSYYAFDREADGKHYYMRHIYTLNRFTELVFTSTNLLFSAQWLENYLALFQLPVVNCSPRGILGKSKARPLAEQLPYTYEPRDREVIAAIVKVRRTLTEKLAEIDATVQRIGESHWNNFLRTTL